MTDMKPDIAIEELREVRHQLSAEFGHDLDRYFAYLEVEQEKYRDQIERFHDLDRPIPQLVETEPMVLRDKPKP